MTQDILWQPWQGTGLEHLRVDEQADQITFDGLIVRQDGQQVTRLGYVVECDARWHVTGVWLRLLGAEIRDLRSDGMGTWEDETGSRHDLTGCIDIDIAASPATNTLPIRRLQLAPDASAEIDVVYI